VQPAGHGVVTPISPPDVKADGHITADGTGPHLSAGNTSGLARADTTGGTATLRSSPRHAVKPGSIRRTQHEAGSSLGGGVTSGINDVLSPPPRNLQYAVLLIRVAGAKLFAAGIQKFDETIRLDGLRAKSDP